MLAVLFVADGRILATDFVRGDANGDGVVTVSDGHFINSSLFRRGATQPGRADRTCRITSPNPFDRRFRAGTCSEERAAGR